MMDLLSELKSIEVSKLSPEQHLVYQDIYTLLINSCECCGKAIDVDAVVLAINSLKLHE